MPPKQVKPNNGSVWTPKGCSKNRQDIYDDIHERPTRWTIYLLFIVVVAILGIMYTSVRGIEASDHKQDVILERVGSTLDYLCEGQKEIKEEPKKLNGG